MMSEKIQENRKARGFTLVEVMIATIILVAVLVAVLGSVKVYFDLIERAQNVEMATFEAQGMLEEMGKRGTITSPVYMSSFNSKGNGRYAVYYILQTGTVIYLEVVIPWREGKRIIGEDANFDGIIDAGEDANPANGRLDSPFTLRGSLVLGEW